jgi:hypothetical protein
MQNLTRALDHQFESCCVLTIRNIINVSKKKSWFLTYFQLHVTEDNL